jgi:hypothetical protein
MLELAIFQIASARCDSGCSKSICAARASRLLKQGHIFTYHEIESFILNVTGVATAATTTTAATTDS